MDLLTIKNSLISGISIFDLPLRVVYYARVSTDKDAQINSLDNQIFYYDDLIKKNINWTFAGGYVDEGISGKSAENRTNFMQMIQDAKNGLFDLIITKEISRFSRSTLDSIKYTQDLLSCGVGVFFQSDNINTLMPDSELRLTIMASIAQEEVRKLSERLRFGYKRAIEQGVVLGQNNILGYNKQNGRLEINDEQAEIVRKIFAMYNEGRFGIRRIARELENEGILSPFTGKMFSPDTIRNVIQNPKYKGYYCSGKTVSLDYRNNKRIRVDREDWNIFKDDSIPAIVSEEEWEKANALYLERGKKSKENAGAYQSRYTFSGKIFCAEHEVSYHRHIYKSKSKGEQEVWNCKLYRQKGKVDGCDSPTLYTAEIQQILNGIYKSIYANKGAVINGLMEIYTSIESTDFISQKNQLEKEAEKIRVKKDKLLELSIDSLISKAEFADRNNRLNGEIEKITQELHHIDEQNRKDKQNKQDLSKLRAKLEEEFTNSDNFNAELNNIFLDKITVHKISSDKRHVRLEIALKLGNTYFAELNRNSLISLDEIGISQAQVSRLEKSALKNMKKYIG